MKKHNKLLKIVTLFTTFAMLGTSLTIHFNTKPVEVDAAQHVDNFASYTYSGTYYNSLNFNASEGLNGQLRQALTTLIYPQGWYTYGNSGEDHLSTQCQYADEDPTNSANMIYLYTRDSVKKNAASSWNREHVWPQSLSNDCWGKTKAGTDLLHIRPTYNSTNSSRSNDKYCDVDKASPRTYNGMTFGYGSGEKFEPLDSVKGDVARIIMYVWVAYKNYYSNLPDITNVFESYDTLLKWHTQDKPDVLEGNRNNYCETSIQKNRNPFVDHPELGWKIFGNSASSSIKTACMNAYPASGSSTPVEATGISLNKSTLSLVTGGESTLTATLTPTGATGTVTWSSNASNIASVNQNGRVTGVSEGTATITAKISNSIKAECLVTVTDSSSTTDEYELLEKFDFVSDLTAYEAYNATKMNAFLRNSSSLGNNTNYVSHDITGTGTNPLIGANGKVGDVTWSYYNMLKLGSTSNNCRMALTFTSGLEISKVVVKAAGWYGKSCQLGINSSKIDITSATTAAGITNETEFLEYEYTFEATNVVTLETTLAVMITEMELYVSAGTVVEKTAKEKVGLLNTRAALSYRYIKESSLESVSDTLNRSITGVSGTSYTSWSNKSLNSDAVYAGQSAGGNESIQLRSKESTSGIITTASGGYAKKITVDWNEGTDASRVLNIYGKNTAYSSPTDLYDDNKSGTLIGSITYGTTEYVIEGNYEYIAVRSNNGALYLNSISFEWSQGASSFTFSNVAIRFGGFLSQTLWDELNEESEIQGYGVMLSLEEDIADYYFELSETKLHPAEANDSQKSQQGIDDEGTYYVWNLYVNIPADQLTDEFTAVAYIATESEIVFFNESTASPKGLANDLLPTYGNDAFEGSLYNLANL